MKKHLPILLVGVLLLVALLPGWNAQAAPAWQGSIPLKNAGFEEGTTNGWSWWYIPDTVDPDINKSWYKPMYVPNQDPKRVHGGSQSIELNNEYRKWRGGVYQTVSATPGDKVVFKIWVQGYISPNGLMLARVGIDPNGGSSADAAQWSGTTTVGESYVQLVSPEVIVGAGGKVTVFTQAEPPAPVNKSAIFLDDATLEITGQGQTQPQPTTPSQPVQPTSPPAQTIKPAPVQADGSIVYTVQSGDTLFAIAIAHDTTVDSIMQLNGMSNTVISVGQKLLIRGPTTPPTATLAPTTAASPTPEPTPVPPTGQICIQAYNDRDGNSQAGGVGEDLLPGVVFALSGSSGVIANYTTDGTNEPHCFVELLPDTYSVKIVPPTGYSATTPEVWSLGLAGGQNVQVSFGAKRGGAAPTATPASQQSSGGGSSSFLAGAGRIILGILAVIVLVGLGAAGMYFVAMRR